MRIKQLLILFVAIAVGCYGCKILGTKKEQTETTSSEIVKPTHLTTEKFNIKVADINATTWKYLGDKPALVDFYADWCGPCKMIAPSLEELAQKYNGQIYIYKVNIDNEPKLAKIFGVSTIPSLLFIPMKGEPQRINGARPKFLIEQKIKSVLLETI